MVTAGSGNRGLESSVVMSDHILPFFATALPEQLLSLIELLNGPEPLATQLEAVAACAAELTASDHADIALFDPLLRRAIPIRSNRVFIHRGDDDAAAWIRSQRSALLVPDLNYASGDDGLTLYNRDISSYAGVPVCIDSQVEAALLVFSRSPRTFEKGEPEVLTALAHLAALAISRHRLQRDLDESSRTLLRLSLTDPATGLATRAQFDQLLDREWQRSVNEGLSLAVMVLRVEPEAGFESGGEHVGAAALAQVARIIQAALYRPGDATARVSACRLAVLLPETDTQGGRAIARRLRRDMNELFSSGEDDGGRLALQIGIAGINLLKLRGGAQHSPDGLYAQAAAALELAISQGEGDQVFTLELD